MGLFSDCLPALENAQNTGIHHFQSRHLRIPVRSLWIKSSGLVEVALAYNLNTLDIFMGHSSFIAQFPLRGLRMHVSLLLYNLFSTLLGVFIVHII